MIGSTNKIVWTQKWTTSFTPSEVKLWGMDSKYPSLRSSSPWGRAMQGPTAPKLQDMKILHHWCSEYFVFFVWLQVQWPHYLTLSKLKHPYACSLHGKRRDCLGSLAALSRAEQATGCGSVSAVPPREFPVAKHWHRKGLSGWNHVKFRTRK